MPESLADVRGETSTAEVRQLLRHDLLCRRPQEHDGCAAVGQGQRYWKIVAWQTGFETRAAPSPDTPDVKIVRAAAAPQPG